jgi:hypothetical protein
MYSHRESHPKKINRLFTLYEAACAWKFGAFSVQPMWGDTREQLPSKHRERNFEEVFSKHVSELVSIFRESIKKF